MCALAREIVWFVRTALAVRRALGEATFERDEEEGMGSSGSIAG